MIRKLFKFYKKDGATIISMNYDLEGFIETDEFQDFLIESGFEVTELSKEEYVDSASKREVILAPGLNYDNLQKLAELAVKTMNRILEGTGMIAAIDYTKNSGKRIAIAL